MRDRLRLEFVSDYIYKFAVQKRVIYSHIDALLAENLIDYNIETNKHKILLHNHLITSPSSLLYPFKIDSLLSSQELSLLYMKKYQSMMSEQYERLLQLNKVRNDVEFYKTFIKTLAKTIPQMD